MRFGPEFCMLSAPEFVMQPSQICHEAISRRVIGGRPGVQDQTSSPGVAVQRGLWRRQPMEVIKVKGGEAEVEDGAGELVFADDPQMVPVQVRNDAAANVGCRNQRP